MSQARAAIDFLTLTLDDFSFEFEISGINPALFQYERGEASCRYAHDTNPNSFALCLLLLKLRYLNHIRGVKLQQKGTCERRTP